MATDMMANVEIDFSGGECGKYAGREEQRRYRYLVAEALTPDNPGRVWGVDAASRFDALRAIHHAHPDHGPLRVVDTSEEEG